MLGADIGAIRGFNTFKTALAPRAALMFNRLWYTSVAAEQDRSGRIHTIFGPKSTHLVTTLL